MTIDLVAFKASVFIEPIHFRSEVLGYSPGVLNQLAWSCLRLDRLHHVINGNKAFKLAGYAAELNASKPWASFGGAFSNHLHALAYYGQKQGIETIGFVRGEDPRSLKQSLSPTLEDCLAWGMHLHFLPRSLYRSISQHSRLGMASKHEQQTALLEGAEWIPEGACGMPGIRGCTRLFQGIQLDEFDCIGIAAATGGMLAGALQSEEWRTSSQVKLIAVPVLKAKGWLEKDLLHYTGESYWPRLEFGWESHWGGYAKSPELLKTFCEEWAIATGIPIEPTYTGKVFYHCFKHWLEGSDTEPSHESLLLVHCGGLQANRPWIQT